MKFDHLHKKNFSPTDCHLSNSEQATKQISIELINPKPSHELNALVIPCIEQYEAEFCLNGGRCFNVTVASFSIPSCECATGFMGERCEQKYLNRSYNPENYMQVDDDIITLQNESKVGEHLLFLDNFVVFIVLFRIRSLPKF